MGLTTLMIFGMTRLPLQILVRVRFSPSSRCLYLLLPCYHCGAMPLPLCALSFLLSTGIDSAPEEGRASGYFGEPMSPIRSTPSKGASPATPASARSTPSRHRARRSGTPAQDPAIPAATPSFSRRLEEERESLTGSDRRRRRSSAASESAAAAAAPEPSVHFEDADMSGIGPDPDFDDDMEGEGPEEAGALSPLPMNFEEDEGEEAAEAGAAQANQRNKKAAAKKAPRTRAKAVRFSEVASRGSIDPASYTTINGVRVRKSLARGELDDDEGGVRRSNRRRWPRLRFWEGERLQFERRPEEPVPVATQAVRLGVEEPPQLPYSVARSMKKRGGKRKGKGGKTKRAAAAAVDEDDGGAEPFPEDQLPVDFKESKNAVIPMDVELNTGKAVSVEIGEAFQLCHMMITLQCRSLLFLPSFLPSLDPVHLARGKGLTKQVSWCRCCELAQFLSYLHHQSFCVLLAWCFHFYQSLPLPPDEEVPPDFIGPEAAASFSTPEFVSGEDASLCAVFSTEPLFKP